MRIAIVSDIHGNIWALEAVVADIKKHAVDLIVNAGDILSGPLEPAATAAYLMPLNWPTIRGNHERQLLACEQRRGGPSDQFAFERIGQAERDWLRALPATLLLAGDIFLCHGTPASDLIYFLEQIDANGAQSATSVSVEQHADGVEHSLIICGHSHLPRCRAISNGRLIVNPGSVGLQAYDDDVPFPHIIENGSPHARYAICEKTATGWHVTQRCVEYDHQAAAATARRNGSERWGRWLETGLA